VANLGRHSIHLVVSTPGRFVAAPPLFHSTFDVSDGRERRRWSHHRSTRMGRNVNLGRELHAKMNNFCILNSQVMRPWGTCTMQSGFPSRVSMPRSGVRVVNVHRCLTTSSSYCRQSQLNGCIQRWTDWITLSIV
jgi:hypothetical protein